MNNEKDSQPSVLEKFAKTDCYDKYPLLYDHEFEALREISSYQVISNSDSGLTKSWRPLERLILPLRIFKESIDHSNSSIGSVSRILFSEMYRTRQSYWGWQKEQWMQTLCFSYETFRNYYKVTNTGVRLFLMGFFYTLTDVFPINVFTTKKASRNTGFFLAKMIFGRKTVEKNIEQITRSLISLGYTPNSPFINCWRGSLCEAMLRNRNPDLEKLTVEIIKDIRDDCITPSSQRGFVAVSQALTVLNILPHPLPPRKRERMITSDENIDDISEEWMKWCQKWKATSVASTKTFQNNFIHLKKIGRWLFLHHPEINSPAQWTRETIADFIAMVDNLKIGDYVDPNNNNSIPQEKLGKPLMSNSKVCLISALRVFIRDCQNWGWIERRFDPVRSIPMPSKFLNERKPRPRVIADDIWAKLLWAGLNLTQADLPVCLYRDRQNIKAKENPLWYPLSMVKAVAIVWLFAGLRGDEIRRLRIGCVREVFDYETENKNGSSETICLLDIPVNKTGSAYTKPVDIFVRESLTIWEKERPKQPKLLDKKTGSYEDFVFMFRGRMMGSGYINDTLIPVLCRKASVPTSDARGTITSHRARSTIATQLFNSKEPMTLFELQQWLGHRSVASTQYYTQITQSKLSASFKNAGYFERNRRTIEVLIDRETIKNGTAASGEAWKYYDLGHGYCSYDFFDKCPHRMACAKCSFYLPKESSRMQLLEARGNLQRMLQEIPLSDEEKAAVEDGAEAVQNLLESLKNVPTPDQV